MDEYIEKYKKIVDKLIVKSFPELKDQEVNISISDKDLRGSLAYAWIPDREICVDRRLNGRVSEEAMEAVMAHELDHLKRTRMGLGVLLDILSGFGELFFRRISRRKEVAADITAINCGLARGLFEYRSFRLQLDDPSLSRTNSLYLSPDEIKQYAQKIGKW